MRESTNIVYLQCDQANSVESYSQDGRYQLGISSLLDGKTPFVFDNFLNYVGGCISRDVPKAIMDYLESGEGEGGKQNWKVLVAKRARDELGLSQKKNRRIMLFKMSNIRCQVKDIIPLMTTPFCDATIRMTTA